MTDRIPLDAMSSDQLDALYDQLDAHTAAEKRLRLAHQARRAKEHQLDDIRRALCDAEVIKDDDPYSHADLADVVRSLRPAAEDETARKLSASELLGHRLLQRAERAEEELAAARVQLTRSESIREALCSRLNSAQNAAALLRQGLIRAEELYAIVEAGFEATPAATERDLPPDFGAEPQQIHVPLPKGR